MSNKNIPIEKVCDVIKKMADLGVWGSVTLCFDDGNVTKIVDNLVWTARDSERGHNPSDPSEIIKAAIPQRKMIVRTGKV